MRMDVDMCKSVGEVKIEGNQREVMKNKYMFWHQKGRKMGGRSVREQFVLFSVVNRLVSACAVVRKRVILS
jgi:hypothetical protein